LEAVKAKEGYHICPSCKVNQVKEQYERCYGCQRKWEYVYDSCCDAGLPESVARDRADSSYPGRGSVKFS